MTTMTTGRPTFESTPPRLSSDGDRAVDLAAMAGLILDPWQAYALDQALGERADGRWAAFEVAAIVPRQNGKGALLEARELAGLFLLGERLIIHTAHEFKTAQEAFRRIRTLIDTTPTLSKRVKRIYASHGDEGIELHSGQRLRFLARSSGSGRGFSGDCVILDEAYALNDDQMAAILPTLSARPNPQVWYTSSAGLAGSEVLRKLRDRGRSGTSPSLCYLEWAARPGPDGVIDPLSRVGWVEANPGMGIRVSEEFVEREQQALGAHEFARERLGVWEEASDDLPFTHAEWEKQADAESKITGKVAFAVEVALDHSSSSIAVAGYRDDGRVHVELVTEEPGTAWVATRLAALVERWDPVMIALDPSSPAGFLAAEVLQRGISTEVLHEMSASELAASLSGLAADVREDQLRHLGQPEVEKALISAAVRPVGDGGRAWGRKKSGADIAALVAITSARWALREVIPEQEVELWGFFDE